MTKVSDVQAKGKLTTLRLICLSKVFLVYICKGYVKGVDVLNA